ncbi:MAG TPA: DUF1295 domain-containing protein, partial [Bacteroidales bacterium]|nr:DUF1295 domain-containing protein [Bacteroidales bacterium]
MNLKITGKSREMRIVTTAILLVFTLIMVPVFSYFFGTAPGATEWQVLQVLMIIAGIAAAYSFLAGELTRNNSQVDKLWSLLPVAYVWVVAGYGGFSSRLVLMAVLVSLWGIRLTINFALKGAYMWRFWGGEEDYRWKALREKPGFSPRWKWTLFNLFFISLYQNVLILLFTLPAVVALQYDSSSPGIADGLVAGLMLFFIIFETVADLQQWKFQSRKKALVKAGDELTGDYKKGFPNKGLWALCRHPNYFAEQAIWVCFYLFTITSGGP